MRSCEVEHLPPAVAHPDVLFLLVAYFGWYIVARLYSQLGYL